MAERTIVIGASLNGIAALRELVKRLPADLPAPVLVVQHVAPHSPGILPELLASAGPLPALHPKDHDRILPGHIYVAPPDRHMLVRDGTIRLSHGPKENLVRPAIDALFRSAAVTHGSSVIGVVLTGQLDDGTAGLLNIKDRGGVAIVQDPFEASAPSMPRSAMRHVKVDYCLKVADIADLLGRLCREPAVDPPPPEDELPLIEDRIAQGLFTVDDWWHLEQMSLPSGLSCPDCGCALYEIDDRRLLRFRCRAGHAFSAESLLSGQSEARNNLLSAAFGALIEEATLAKRVCNRGEYTSEIGVRTRLADHARWLGRNADQICAWLRETSGVVDAEPEATAITRIA